MGEPTVIDVECSMCDAKPGEDCEGPGDGWHVSRFYRLDQVRAFPPGGDDRG